MPPRLLTARRHSATNEDRPGRRRRISDHPFVGGAWTANGPGAFTGARRPAVGARARVRPLSPTTAGVIGQSVRLDAAFYPLSLPGV